jgi:hypothetical protein
MFLAGTSVNSSAVDEGYVLTLDKVSIITGGLSYLVSHSDSVKNESE